MKPSIRIGTYFDKDYNETRFTGTLVISGMALVRNITYVVFPDNGRLTIEGLQQMSSSLYNKKYEINVTPSIIQQIIVDANAIDDFFDFIQREEALDQI